MARRVLNKLASAAAISVDGGRPDGTKGFLTTRAWFQPPTQRKRTECGPIRGTIRRESDEESTSRITFGIQNALLVLNRKMEVP